MNMLDTKKSFRGVLLWREDILKCAKIVRKPLSEFIRELFHAEMTKHRLSDEDNALLSKQIEAAKVKRDMTKALRKAQKGKRGRKRTMVEDVMTIPSKVRRNAKFVKG